MPSKFNLKTFLTIITQARSSFQVSKTNTFFEMSCIEGLSGKQYFFAIAFLGVLAGFYGFF
jgi:hypothetical protein